MDFPMDRGKLEKQKRDSLRLARAQRNYWARDVDTVVGPALSKGEEYLFPLVACKPQGLAFCSGGSVLHYGGLLSSLKPKRKCSLLS